MRPFMYTPARWEMIKRSSKTTFRKHIATTSRGLDVSRNISLQQKAHLPPYPWQSGKDGFQCPQGSGEGYPPICLPLLYRSLECELSDPIPSLAFASALWFWSITASSGRRQMLIKTSTLQLLDCCYTTERCTACGRFFVGLWRVTRRRKMLSFWWLNDQERPLLKRKL